jgi:hypothetical protein
LSYEYTNTLCTEHSRYYAAGKDGYAFCPLCVPGQPKPLAIRASDPTDFLGVDYYWSWQAGPRGMWLPLKDYVVLGADGFKELNDAVTEARVAGCGGLALLPAATRTIQTLRGVDPGARTPTRQVSFSELADKAQRTEEDLRRVRADRDELRDRVAELEAKLAERGKRG